ncbi:MAG: hypothetical protein ACXVCP_13795 [Bdellovibrio sp.]
MKKLFALFLLSVFPFASFAQPVLLKPGSSVEINGDVISCDGPTDGNLLPQCNLQQDLKYSNVYLVYAGSTVVNTFVGFDQALEGLKKIKVAGLCR